MRGLLSALVLVSLFACGGPGGGSGGTGFTIGGSIAGLSGTGLVLQDNGGSGGARGSGGSDLSVSTNGSFVFPVALSDGAAYDVTIKTQPTGQNCTLTNSTGTVSGANVTSVGVSCVTTASTTYTIGGNVTGLTGTGLVLQNNLSDNLSITANGAFTFASGIADGNNYNVTVATQPTGQLCTVTNGSGSVATANVSNVAVNCVTAYTIGGTVSGLSGTGLVLQNNAGDNLSISANGSFAFSTPLLDTSAYAVSVLTNPSSPNQTCVVSNASGTVSGANVTNVNVVCTTTTYTIGGTVSGLSGTGLVLQNNGGDNLTISANGSFTFATPINDGSTYAVTVLANPTGPNQTCVVTSGSGTLSGANVSNVSISCTTNTYTVGGSVSGLTATGLVLQNNGGDNLSITASGSFTFATALTDGSSYAVTVSTQPLGQICSVSGGTGTLSGANVTTVSISCAAVPTYTIGGSVSGLTGAGLVLQNNGGDNLSIGANGSFTFATPINDGSTYAVTVSTQPAGQSCSVTGGSGTVSGGNVTSVSITCAALPTYTIGGTVSGLTTAMILRNNGGDDLYVSTNGSFTFATALDNGASYNVSIATQPPGQSCTVTNGTGNVSGGNVTSVSISCTNLSLYTIGGSVSGLVGSGLVLQDDGTDDLTISANGGFTFATPIYDTYPYNVTIKTQPFGQICSVTNGSGNVPGANVTNVSVTCVSVPTHTIGGSVSGLTGTGLVLSDNGGDFLSVTANGSFTFPTALNEGDSYLVKVQTQPTGQTCIVSNSFGTVATSNITNIGVTCTANVAGYHVGGTVNGLSGTVVLDLNGVEQLPFNYNGGFTFSTILTSGTNYTVTVAQQPTNMICSVDSGSGTIANSDFPFVEVTCVNAPSAGVHVKMDISYAYLNSGDSVGVTLNGTENKTLTWSSYFNLFFSTTLYDTDTYSVAVTTQPTGRMCWVKNAIGVVSGATTPPPVYLECSYDTTGPYTVGGSVTGLTTSGLVLSLSGSEDLAIPSGASSYTFATTLPNSSNFNVYVKTQPAGQLCSVSPDYGYISSANVTNINITCSDGSYSVGGYVGTLTGTGLSLSLNGGDILPISTSGNFTFPTGLSASMSYDVAVASQPSGQTCTVSRGQGLITSASISDVYVSCSGSEYSVAVNMTGYNSTTPLELLLNGSETMSLSANTKYATYQAPKPFNTLFDPGDPYEVQILAQPEGQVCTLTNAVGTIGSTAVTNVGVVCVSEAASSGPYTVGVSVSGLLGSGLTLQLNGANDLVVSTNGYSTFATTLADTTGYTVSVLTQPNTPLQKCQVINGSGTIAGANVTQVAVSCGNAVTALYPGNGSRWLDYVKNDGASTTSATDTACDPATDGPGYSACLNGGEFMQISLPSVPNCTGVTASDNLNAFNWVCDTSTGSVRVVSTGLKAGVALSNLMDFTKGQFKQNFVSINENGPVENTQSAIWWTNKVYINNPSDGQCCIYNNDIHLVTDNALSQYTMPSNSALLVKPGMAIKGYGAGANIISASNRNFLWFEGDVNSGSSTSWDGVGWNTVNFSVVRNSNLLNNGSYGLTVIGDNNFVDNVTANNNASVGMYFRGHNIAASNLTANSNLGFYGIDVSVQNSVFSNLVASNNTAATGIRFSAPTTLLIDNVTANNNGSIGLTMGTYPSPASNISMNNVTTNGNGSTGFYIDTVSNSQFANVTSNSNGGNGVEILEATGNDLTNVVSNNNAQLGARLYRWSTGTIDGFTTSSNASHGVVAIQGSFSRYNNIYSANNGGDGFQFDSPAGDTWVNVRAVNNTGTGINYPGTGGGSSVLINATSTNNGSYGFAATRMSNNKYSSMALANNGADGLYTYVFIDNQTVSDLVSANNTGYGINLGSDYDYFTGLLEVGNNGLGDCFVDTTFLTSPGLAQVPGKGKALTNDCQNAGTSDSTIISAINLVNSFVGKVTTDDITNAADNATPGTALFQNITDWSAFDNTMRAWGKDGLAFADASNQAACLVSGETCRIWDWSMAAGDTGNSGSPALLGVLALPTGNDVLTHTWPVSFSIASQADCDTYYPGSTWNGSSCQVTYLKHATEIAGDAIGNDNYLCESGETCLYTPNVGSYQGHGSLVSAGSFTGGTLTGITLMKYSSNGY